MYDRLRAGSLQGVGFLLSYGDPQESVSLTRTIHRHSSTRISVHIPSPAIIRGGTPWLHRRRELRHIDVAASPRETTPEWSWCPSRRLELCPGSTPNASSALRPSRRASIRSSTTTLSMRCSSSRGITRMQIWCARPWSAVSPSLSRSRSRSLRSNSTTVLDTVERTGNDRVMVGFNRRFAPLFTDLRRTLRSVPRPVVGSLLDQRGPLGRRQLVSQRGTRGIAVRR